MQIQDTPPASSADHAPEPGILLGRAAEREQIDTLLRTARGGQSAVLVVRGDAGMGKSALLAQAHSAAPDMLVLSCCGIESEAELPFAALHQLLRGVLDDADALPEVQAEALRGALGVQPGARPERFLVSIAALSLLAETAERRPVLCLVDDAHWLDEASAEALGFVARRLQAEPIVMLVATRECPTSSFDERALPTLVLDGLPSSAARELLSTTGPNALAPEVENWLLGASDGNPLALLELAAGMSDAQRTGLEPVLGPLPVSDHIEHAFLRRVRRLGPAAQQLLLVAAADESGDLTTVLDGAARCEVPAGALDEAERAGLLRVQGLEVCFRHPLVRSAVYQSATHSERRAAHGALADVLVGEARADRRAWHRAAASVEPDPVVVAELESAAQNAQERGGYDAASLALERAATLTPGETARARLLASAAENAWLSGQVPRSLTLLRRARALTSEPPERAEIDRVAGIIELTCGVPSESSQMLFAAAAAVTPDDPERALHLLSLASQGATFARDAGAIEAIAQSAQRLPVADTPQSRFLLARLSGLQAHFSGRHDAAAPCFECAIELADRAEGMPHLLGLTGPVGLFLCDDRAVVELHRRAATRAREHGTATLLAQALPWIALGDLWAGHWPAAAAHAEEGLELATATAQHQIEAHMQAVQALIAAHRGDEERCRALAAEALRLAAARRLVHVSCCATWALEVLELSLSQPEAALAHARLLPPTAGVDWDALDRIEAAIRAGDEATASAWLDAFEPWAHSSGAPWGKAVALHCRALLANDPAEAERLYRDALAAHEQAGRPFERARTELAFGEFLRRARRRTEARTQLYAALQRFELLGADLWAERAQRELRASGERARKRDPSTIDELTAQELQVAQLVSEGRTNRDVAAELFLSPRTIDFHLRNVFRKLGIGSRTELVRMQLAHAGHATPMRPTAP